MTRDQAKALLPIIQAFADGREIEVQYTSSTPWRTLEDPKFDDIPDKYRVKLTPQYRPWKAEEVPVGALLRDKSVTYLEAAKVLIIGIRGSWVHFLCPVNANLRGELCHTLSSPNWEHSRDGGASWAPCGVPI